MILQFGADFNGNFSRTVMMNRYIFLDIIID